MKILAISSPSFKTNFHATGSGQPVKATEFESRPCRRNTKVLTVSFQRSIQSTLRVERRRGEGREGGGEEERERERERETGGTDNTHTTAKRVFRVVTSHSPK